MPPWTWHFSPQKPKCSRICWRFRAYFSATVAEDGAALLVRFAADVAFDFREVDADDLVFSSSSCSFSRGSRLARTCAFACSKALL